MSYTSVSNTQEYFPPNSSYTTVKIEDNRFIEAKQRFEKLVPFFKPRQVGPNIFSVDAPDIKFWIGGGCLRDYFSGKNDFSDIDVFFPNAEEWNKAVNQLIQLRSKKQYETQNTIRYKYKGKGIDLIKRFFPTPLETIKTFDFTVCSVAMDKENVYYIDSFFMDLAKRKLVINNPHHPLGTLQRLQKYIKKGFTICDGGLLTIAKAIQQADFNNPQQNVFQYDRNGRVKILYFD